VEAVLNVAAKESVLKRVVAFGIHAGRLRISEVAIEEKIFRTLSFVSTSSDYSEAISDHALAIKKAILKGISLDSLLVDSVVIAIELEDCSVVWSCSCELNSRKLSIPAAVRLEGRARKRRSDRSHQPASAIDCSPLQLCDGRRFVYQIVRRGKVKRSCLL